ncbi:hypothetical protein LJC04_01510 [Ruminococcaceae bacterium OttesenSCG-928-O06]|nr:hypothetical protein [Ruminococcaceae bacterium OttesenSCG-928-O06]
MRHEPLSFEEAAEALDEVAAALPESVFAHLNGGVVLLPDAVPSPHGQGLQTLGAYHYDPRGLGRYITIHYGSFVAAYGHCPPAQQRAALKEVLHHELTHHVESLAGIRDLDYKDQLFLEQYKKPEKSPKKHNKKKENPGE